VRVRNSAGRKVFSCDENQSIFFNGISACFRVLTGRGFSNIRIIHELILQSSFHISDISRFQVSNSLICPQVP